MVSLRRMSFETHLLAAEGYLDLGMPQKAWDELEEIAPEDRTRVETLLMRLAVLQSLEKWEFAATIARGAVQKHPDCADLYILGACVIRRAENLEAAFAFLQSGHLCMEENATFWFNLGCYHCQLGRMDEAIECVRLAVEIDLEFKRMAVEDGDLEPMWEEIKVQWP